MKARPHLLPFDRSCFKIAVHFYRQALSGRQAGHSYALPGCYVHAAACKDVEYLLSTPRRQ
jgi:hypothetical protein